MLDTYITLIFMVLGRWPCSFLKELESFYNLGRS